MEIPSAVDSERHSASGSQTFGAQGLNPEIPDLSEKEDHCVHDVPLRERSLGSEEETQNRSMEFACQGNTERSPDDVDQNTAGQILSCEPSGCVRSLESSPTLTAHPNGPSAAQNFLPVPRIVKHKQSSITFLDRSDAEDHRFGNEGSENGQEQDGRQFHDADENDDYDDDVFKELPIRRELLANNRSIHRKMRGAGSLKVTKHSGCEAEEEVCCSLSGLYTSFSEYTIQKNK